MLTDEQMAEVLARSAEVLTTHDQASLTTVLTRLRRLATDVRFTSNRTGLVQVLTVGNIAIQHARGFRPAWCADFRCAGVIVCEAEAASADVALDRLVREMRTRRDHLRATLEEIDTEAE